MAHKSYFSWLAHHQLARGFGAFVGVEPRKPRDDWSLETSVIRVGWL